MQPSRDYLMTRVSLEANLSPTITSLLIRPSGMAEIRKILPPQLKHWSKLEDLRAAMHVGKQTFINFKVRDRIMMILIYVMIVSYQRLVKHHRLISFQQSLGFRAKEHGPEEWKTFVAKASSTNVMVENSTYLPT